MGIWTSVIACFWDVDGRYVWTLSAFFACALHFMHYSFVKCPSGALDKGENEKGKDGNTDCLCYFSQHQRHKVK